MRARNAGALRCGAPSRPGARAGAAATRGRERLWRRWRGGCLEATTNQHRGQPGASAAQSSRQRLADATGRCRAPPRRPARATRGCITVHFWILSSAALQSAADRSTPHKCAVHAEIANMYTCVRVLRLPRRSAVSRAGSRGRSGSVAARGAATNARSVLGGRNTAVGDAVGACKRAAGAQRHGSSCAAHGMRFCAACCTTAAAHPLPRACTASKPPCTGGSPPCLRGTATRQPRCFYRCRLSSSAPFLRYSRVVEACANTWPPMGCGWHAPVSCCCGQSCM